MSDFDDLQAALHFHAGARRDDQQTCENLLHALYHALRHEGGPGRPLNNVSMDMVPDPMQRLRPVPLGEFYAAWYRLGLCEVLVRVRFSGDEFHGDYGPSGVFSVGDLSTDAIKALACQILRDLAAQYSPLAQQDRQSNLN